ncbi:MAG: heavy metal translocating P-type ATPase [Pseudobdellovibrio sp.]
MPLQKVKPTSEKWIRFNNDSVEKQFRTEIRSDSKVFKFHIEGLQCSSCVHLLEDFPQYFDRILKARINYAKAVLEVEVKAELKLGDLCQVIEELGYFPTPLKEAGDYQQAVQRENRRDLKRIGVAGAVAANEMLFSIPLYAGLTGSLSRAFEYIGLVLFLPLVFYSAVPFYKKAWSGFLARRISVDLMIVFALWAGFISSCYSLWLGKDDLYFDSSSSFIFLILSTRYLLKHYQNKFVKKNILSEMFNGEIYEVIEKNRSVFKTFGEIKENQEVLVQKNQFIPFDAVLKSQVCYLDLSFITGESYPQIFHSGDVIRAGSRALEDEVRLLCTQEAGNTRLAQSLNQLDLAVSDKNKFQSLTDLVAHRLTLVVFSLAALYFIMTFHSLGYESFKRCLALITIACPCAVAFGTPLAHNMGMALALRKGFLIKSENVFEKLGEIKRIIFDKTGTLTSSELKLIKTFPEVISDENRRIILGLEKQSMHPIALSLKKAWSFEAARSIPNVIETAGLGVEAEVDGRLYQIVRSVDEKNPSVIQVDFRVNHQLSAYLYFEEKIQSEAYGVIEELYKRSYDVMILSGDKRSRVIEVAKKLSIRPAFAFSEQTSDSKMQQIEQQNPCLYIGDGLNDLQALSKAHVSFAVRGPFEATMQVSDIYAPQKKLNSILEIIDIAERVQKTVQANLLFAVFYNAVGGTLALMGFINPLLAAILMPISSVLLTTHTVWRLKK